MIQADAVACNGANVAPLARTAGLYVPVQPLRGYSITAPAKRKSIKDHLTFAPSRTFTRRGLARMCASHALARWRPCVRAGPGEPNEGLAKALRELWSSRSPMWLIYASGTRRWHGSAQDRSRQIAGRSPARRACRAFISMWATRLMAGVRRCSRRVILAMSSRGEETQEAAVGRQYSPRRFQPLPWTWYDVLP